MWSALIVAVVGIVGFASLIASFAVDVGARHSTEVRLGDLREVILQQDGLHWEALAEGRVSPALEAKIQAVEAQAVSDLEGVRPLLSANVFNELSRQLNTYTISFDAQMAAIAAGHVDQATAVQTLDAGPAFAAIDASIEATEATAGIAGATAAGSLSIGAMAGFAAAALAATALFVLYRRRIFAARRATSLAHERDVAVRAISRLGPRATPAATGQQITDALLDLPDVDVAVVLGFVGSGGVRVLSMSGPAGFPLQPDDLLPGDRAAQLRERAPEGSWAESWVGRSDGGEYGMRLQAAGLKAVGFGAIGRAGDPVGLLVIGTTIAANETRIVENLPAITEFATIATVLLGDRLVEERDLAGVRAEIEAIIAKGLFRVVFQPIVHLSQDRTIGYEALTRFADARAPDVVFAEAARAGIGDELEAATLAAAVQASHGLPVGPWLSLNVSARFAMAGDQLRRILSLRTRPVVIEITEHETIGDYAAVRKAIAALGPDVRIAVDDAGSGAANFAHIVELRPHFIKVDALIVRGVDVDLTRQGVVAGLGHFAKTMHAWLLAEGVETPAESAALAALGIEFGQGYLWSRPADAATFGDRLVLPTPDPPDGGPVVRTRSKPAPASRSPRTRTPTARPIAPTARPIVPAA